MATEITLTLENKPGTLAATLDVLAEAGINLNGILGIICEGQGIVRMARLPLSRRRALSICNARCCW